MAEEYLFAPYVTLEERKVPQELIDLCGGPEEFLAIQRELRNTPLSDPELNAAIRHAIEVETRRQNQDNGTPVSDPGNPAP